MSTGVDGELPLDDRQFQDLVDEARRAALRLDPGVDLGPDGPHAAVIEAAAFLADQLIARIAQVPVAVRSTLLGLLGERPFPATAAAVDLTFHLAGASETPVDVPAGTTAAVGTDETLTFETVQDARVPGRLLGEALGQPADGAAGTMVLLSPHQPGACFQDPPRPGDSLLLRLDSPAPAALVGIGLEVRTPGFGVAPDDAPLRWEAYGAGEWQACEVVEDATGALSRSGTVRLQLPPAHDRLEIGWWSGWWIRCRVTEPQPAQPAFASSPVLTATSVSAEGVTVRAVHGTVVRGEVLGVSAGRPGQRFRLRHRPLAAGDPLAVDGEGPDGSRQRWTEVTDFAAAGPADAAVVVDRNEGEIRFGPAVRQPDGTVRQYGAVPPAGWTLRVAAYRTGGGRRGNVPAGAVSTLVDPLPGIGRVVNRRPASGGIDPESGSEALTRLAISYGSDRAVTARDVERIARSVSPWIARVGCFSTDGAIHVLVVPRVAARDDGSLRFQDLQPDEEAIQRIVAALDERRLVGTSFRVEPPYYLGLQVTARLQVQALADPHRVSAAVTRALHDRLSPVCGGPERSGWPFGRWVTAPELTAVVTRVPGVDIVYEVQVAPADPLTGEIGATAGRIEPARDQLPFCAGVQVSVEKR